MACFSFFKKPLKRLKSTSGFGLASVIIALVVISVMIASAIPYMEGFNELKQAKSVLNSANSIIKAEIQYQQADYSNYAEQNKTPSNNDYFGNLTQLITGLNVLPSNNLQRFLPAGTSLSLADYQGNNGCINKDAGGAELTLCLNDEENGQFKLLIYGFNNPNLTKFVPMFENGIKGGLSAYSGGILSTQISVPFGFSAYPKIQNGGGNTTVNNNTTVVEGGGGGAAVPNVQCTEWGISGNCGQYTFSNGAQTTNLDGYSNNPGSVCIEVSPTGTCEAWSR